MCKRLWEQDWGILNYKFIDSLPVQDRVDLEYFESNTAFAQYTTFTVANGADKYRLLVSGYSGTAGDAMSYNSGHG